MPSSFEICRQSARDIYEDLSLLGVRLSTPLNDDTQPEKLWEYVHTQVVLSKSARRNPEQAPPIAGTSFGKKVVEMLEATETGKFACKVPRVGNHACERTEPRFLQAAGQLTGSLAADDPFCPNPILVTQDAELCGLLKFTGDNTLLGLQDTPDTPIREGGVYGFSNDFTINLRRLRKAAKELPQAAIVEYCDIIDIVGPPDALRPSYFTLGQGILTSFATILGKPLPTIEQIRTPAATYITAHHHEARRRGSEVLAAFHTL